MPSTGNVAALVTHGEGRRRVGGGGGEEANVGIVDVVPNAVDAFGY